MLNAEMASYLRNARNARYLRNADKFFWFWHFKGLAVCFVVAVCRLNFAPILNLEQDNFFVA